MSGSRYRLRDPQRVVDEMEHICKTFNTQKLVILDDTFTAVPKKLTLPVCAEIERRGLEITFNCESRVDVITPDLLKTLYKAGCRMIQFGVESGSPRVLEKLHKRINLDQVRSAVQVAVDLGITLACTFILGHPFEEVEDVQQTISLMNELRGMGVQQTPLSFLTPFPGTEIYEHRAEYGITLHETDWGRFTFDTPSISTRYLSREQLRHLVVDAYLQLPAVAMPAAQIN
jgi:anaerobic magnesium-protoporphyrin IX monomethyl ester cyclase